MKVLIAGAAGFLGSHLAQACRARGDHTIGVDNFASSSIANLAGLANDAGFSFVEADVARGLPDAGPIDAVLHFASPASPKDYASIPIETLEVNSRGTQNCCRLALRYGARLLYASTSEVYGDPAVHPQPETYWGNVNSIGERSCYDEGKRFGEAMVMAYARIHGLDARIVRIFNTYGPRMRANDGRVVPTLVRQALAGEPLTIFGDGTQTRSLCYVDDLVDGILRFLDHPRPGERVINLGSEDELTVNEIAQTVARLCGVAVTMRREPLPPDDPARRRPDLTRAKSILGWSPQTPLQVGLSKTIAWFKEELQTEKGVPARC